MIFWVLLRILALDFISQVKNTWSRSVCSSTPLCVQKSILFFCFVSCPCLHHRCRAFCSCCWMKGFKLLGWSWHILQSALILGHLVHITALLSVCSVVQPSGYQSGLLVVTLVKICIVFFPFFLLSPPFSTHPNPGTVWVTSVCRGFSLLGAWLESSTGQLPFHQMCWNHVSRLVSSMPDCHGHTQHSAPGNGVGSDGRCHLNIFGGREPTLSAAWDKHTKKWSVSSFLVGFLANRQIWL